MLNASPPHAYPTSRMPRPTRAGAVRSLLPPQGGNSAGARSSRSSAVLARLAGPGPPTPPLQHTHPLRPSPLDASLCASQQSVGPPLPSPFNPLVTSGFGHSSFRDPSFDYRPDRLLEPLLISSWPLLSVVPARPVWLPSSPSWRAQVRATCPIRLSRCTPPTVHRSAHRPFLLPSPRRRRRSRHLPHRHRSCWRPHCSGGAAVCPTLRRR